MTRREAALAAWARRRTPEEVDARLCKAREAAIRKADATRAAKTAEQREVTRAKQRSAALTAWKRRRSLLG